MADHKLVSGMAALLLASGMATTPVRSDSGTPCTFEFVLVADPGLTTSPSSGTISTNGETGTITCDGPVNGRQPTGPGTVGADGRYGVQRPYACQDDGHGEAAVPITIPTSDGQEHFVNTISYTHGAYQDGQLFGGTFRGDRMSGTFEAEPMDGDCVQEPITKFHIRAKGILK